MIMMLKVMICGLEFMVDLCDWKQFIDELCRNLERFICIVRKENKKLFELKEYAQIVSALEYIKTDLCVEDDGNVV